MSDFPLVAALVLGLASSLHCVGMCGGVVGMLSMSLPERVRSRRGSLLVYTLAYNFGRIAGYAGAGLLVGGLVQVLLPEVGLWLLRAVALLAVVAVGLYYGGWWPRLALVERLGLPLWRLLEPLGRRLLPVRSPVHAVLFGFVWGWLPCSPVYSALLLAGAQAQADRAALTMLVFGLGTLPVLVTGGVLVASLTRLRHAPGLRRGLGVLLVGFGLLGLVLAVLPHGGDPGQPHFHPAPGLESHG